MRGAFGKAYGKAARIYIGKILFSIRTVKANVDYAVDALRRAKAKMPGR